MRAGGNGNGPGGTVSPAWARLVTAPDGASHGRPIPSADRRAPRLLDLADHGGPDRPDQHESGPGRVRWAAGPRGYLLVGASPGREGAERDPAALRRRAYRRGDAAGLQRPDARPRIRWRRLHGFGWPCLVLQRRRTAGIRSTAGERAGPPDAPGRRALRERKSVGKGNGV